MGPRCSLEVGDFCFWEMVRAATQRKGGEGYLRQFFYPAIGLWQRLTLNDTVCLLKCIAVVGSDSLAWLKTYNHATAPYSIRFFTCYCCAK